MPHNHVMLLHGGPKDGLTYGFASNTALPKVIVFQHIWEGRLHEYQLSADGKSYEYIEEGVPQ